MRNGHRAGQGQGQPSPLGPGTVPLWHSRDEGQETSPQPSSHLASNSGDLWTLNPYRGSSHESLGGEAGPIFCREPSPALQLTGHQGASSQTVLGDERAWVRVPSLRSLPWGLGSISGTHGCSPPPPSTTLHRPPAGFCLFLWPCLSHFSPPSLPLTPDHHFPPTLLSARTAPHLPPQEGL